MKEKKLDISISEIQNIKELYDKWVRLEKEGKLKMRYSKDWWLNVKNDPMYVFFIWLLDNRKNEKKTR